MSNDRLSLPTCREISLQSPVTAAAGAEGTLLVKGLSELSIGCLVVFDVNEKTFLVKDFVFVDWTSSYLSLDLSLVVADPHSRLFDFIVHDHNSRRGQRHDQYFF
jgi:hypothetical protein